MPSAPRRSRRNRLLCAARDAAPSAAAPSVLARGFIRPRNDTVNDWSPARADRGWFLPDMACIPKTAVSARESPCKTRTANNPRCCCADHAASNHHRVKKPGARWVGHYREWLYVCALNRCRSQSPPAWDRIDPRPCAAARRAYAKARRVCRWDYRRRPVLDGSGTLVHRPEGWKPGDPLPNSGHLGGHSLRLWAK